MNKKEYEAAIQRLEILRLKVKSHTDLNKDEETEMELLLTEVSAYEKVQHVKDSKMKRGNA